VGASRATSPVGLPSTPKDFKVRESSEMARRTSFNDFEDGGWTRPPRDATWRLDDDWDDAELEDEEEGESEDDEEDSSWGEDDDWEDWGDAESEEDR